MHGDLAARFLAEASTDDLLAELGRRHGDRQC